ncbi:MAG: signal peptidase I [Polyangiaceae bacterium]|nr:signal peptidase I [Polyangiaceae bacterium]
MIEPTEVTNEKRRAPRPAPISCGVAMLVSLVMGPGMGHYLVGRVRGGFAFSGGAFLALWGGLGSVMWNPTVGLLLLGVAFLIYIGAVVDLGRLSPEDLGPAKVFPFIAVGGAMFGLPIVGAVFLRTFVVEAFKIPSSAMTPTLRVGDHVFVDKMHHGADAAERGAIVVFPYPANPKQDFIKRIVGLPGDEIETRGSSLFVNGFELKRCRLGRITVSVGSGPSGEMEAYVEFLGSRAYIVFYNQERVEEPRRWTVGDGEVFVFGDNRDNSHDSRAWREGRGGGVPIVTLKGQATRRFLRVGEVSGAPVDEIVSPSSSPEVKRQIDDCLARRPSTADATPPPPR